jgi:PTH2 family peptidyl-tRNA hydrolase
MIPPAAPSEPHRPPKQVIVIRRDLKMGRGKEVSQGAHASMAALLSLGRLSRCVDDDNQTLSLDFVMSLPPTRDHLAVQEWLEGAFTKICLQVDTEAELLAVHAAARAAGLPCALIQDSGKTEFHGVPTHTAVAVGPGYPDRIDPITGSLKRY